MRCLFLLRGIDVGGHNKVPMAGLRAYASDLGLRGSGAPRPPGRNAVCESVQQRHLWTDFLEPRPLRSLADGERPGRRGISATGRRPAGRRPVHNSR